MSLPIIALYLLSIIGIIGAFIPLFPEQTWWLRAWTYSRVQMAVINSILFTMCVFVLNLSSSPNTALAVLLAISMLLCIRDIIPFAPFSPKQSPSVQQGDTKHSIAMVLGNVLMDNKSSEGLLSSIKEKDPDIVFLVETNEVWRKYLVELEDIYPHQHLLPLEDYNGMLFYSKFEILNVEERYLVQDHIPSLRIDLDVKGSTVRFFGIHPRPPRPEDDTEDMDKELKIVAREVRDCNYPVIVSGDLNDVGWSSTTKQFLETSGLLDPRRGRGLYNTFHAQYPVVRWPLDHLFHSDHFGVVAIERLPKFGSDHFPMFIHLGVKDSAAE